MKKTKQRMFATVSLAVILFASVVISQEVKWKVHDMNRPLPPIVEPGHCPADPPSDALVLFDSKNLDQWVTDNPPHGPAKWKVEDGVLTIGPGSTGSIRTKARFGDCQLHIEWRAPEESHGNSGIFFQELYELQIYDSYQNKQKIYADGMAAAIYGQQVPLVNACRPPGEWQTFDIIFRAPRFDEKGKVTKPGSMTVLHNGVAVHVDAEILGYTVHGKPATYRVHPPELPLMLQNHGDPVSFRNIWIRRLKGLDS